MGGVPFFRLTRSGSRTSESKGYLFVSLLEPTVAGTAVSFHSEELTPPALKDASGGKPMNALLTKETVYEPPPPNPSIRCLGSLGRIRITRGRFSARVCRLI